MVGFVSLALAAQTLIQIPQVLPRIRSCVIVSSAQTYSSPGLTKWHLVPSILKGARDLELSKVGCSLVKFLLPLDLRQRCSLGGAGGSRQFGCWKRSGCGCLRTFLQYKIAPTLPSQAPRWCGPGRSVGGSRNNPLSPGCNLGCGKIPHFGVFVLVMRISERQKPPACVNPY